MIPVASVPRLWSLPLLLWVMLWSTINSGPWHLVYSPSGLTGWANAIRAAMPLLILGIWVASLVVRTRGARTPTGPETLWILYALIAFAAALAYDRWFDIGYWALAYLSVFAAIDLTLRESPLSRATAVVWVNWFLATVFLVAMLVFAREVLFVEGKTGLTAYGVVNRAQAVGGAPIARSSGLARLAIVPVVVGFVLMFHARGARRLLWAALCVAAAVMIWFFQSRQGIIGMALALALVMLLLGGRARALGVVAMAVGVVAFYADLAPEFTTYVVEHAMRGEGLSAFESMTGRDVIWLRGWRAVENAPLIGYGPQADRRVIHLNAQNGALYAALCAGYLGAALYAGGMGWGWLLFHRAVRYRYARTFAERLFLIQVGGVMAYLTVRNIPENTAALFSVDLLLHASMLAYLGTLDRERRRRGMRRRVARVAPFGAPKGRLVPAGVRKSPRAR